MLVDPPASCVGFRGLPEARRLLKIPDVLSLPHAKANLTRIALSAESRSHKPNVHPSHSAIVMNIAEAGCWSNPNYSKRDCASLAPEWPNSIVRRASSLKLKVPAGKKEALA